MNNEKGKIMRKVRKLISLLLVCAIMAGFVPSAFANEIAARGGVTELDNAYIKVTVDNDSGRFSIRTADGQPARKNDQNANLLYGDETSFTTFKINGTDYIFGNEYKFELFQSSMSLPKVVENEDGTKEIDTVWSIQGVEITQIIKLYPTDDKVNGGNVAVRYAVNNKSNAKVELGTRILLDTQVGANDGPPMQMGAISDSPLSVERMLTHDPKNDQGIPDRDVNFYKIPAYWIMKDNLDPSNPLATNVFAYGFNNIAEAGVNILDKMIVGHWNRLANTKWIPVDAEGNEVPAQEGLDFTTDTNDYGSADSAVALFWEPESISAGQTQTFETVYGLGEIIDPTTIFSIRFLDVPAMLETNEDKTAFQKYGVFKVRAEVENLAMYNMEHSEITATLSLDSGLSFAATDDLGNPIINPDGTVKTETGTGRTKTVTVKKQLTPEEAEAGVKATWKPGEIVPVEFTVVAKGNPWPSTKAYMLTASSPETEKQVGNVEDAELKALYNASRSSYIFLPPVGTATPTQVYELSPEEVFWQDDKYITINLSNIEAYNTGEKGNDKNVANFDAYLVNAATKERWKVPVTDSAVISNAGSGYTGDMRINYKYGEKVDELGNRVEGSFYIGNEEIKYNNGPELPLGEYCVQLDFKGGPQTTPEDKQLLSVTSSQTFMVTTNKAAKIRNVGLLAVVKTNEDVGSWGGVLENTLNTLTSPAQLVDPEFELPAYNTCDDNISGVDGNCSYTSPGRHSLVPTYSLVPFESKEDFEKVFDDTNNDDNRWVGKNEKGEIIECMVTIEGIIRMVGDEGDIYVVDTATEPAIINGAVAYKGTDLMFTKTSFLDYFSFFGLQGAIKSALDTAGVPTTYLDALSIEGNGTLSIPSSGFTFHSGKWSIDFYNGFNKHAPEAKQEEEEEEDSQSPEDDSLNGSLSWAAGGLADRLNPLRQLAISDVYFNQHSLFSAPSFSVAGFGLSFNEFILKQNAITFGGSVDMSIVKAEIQGVGFDTEGFRFIESELSFELGEEMGLFSGGGEAGGSIILNHFRTPDLGKGYYGIKFNADMKNIAKVSVELAFARVPDGRILPDVIGFGAGFPDPGITISAGTYLKGVRGAIRELAETIAGGDGEVPLTIEAGVDIGFGVAPAEFEGAIDMTLKTSGIKLVGKLDFNEMPMLTYALIEARWFTPWFVKAEAEVDVMGWGILIGNCRLFLGQNLELNRIDFEGLVSTAIVIPEIVPIVGGIELRKMTLGANNDKIWGSIGILMIELGITYWWSGKLEFMTDGSDMPDAYAYLLMTDPDTGEQNLMLIGEGIQTLATSRTGQELETQTLEFHDVGNGMQVAEQGQAGIGGIDVTNMGKTHSIPMGEVKKLTTPSDAMLEIEYFGSKAPTTLKLMNGSTEYPIKVMPADADMAQATASGKYNAFVQEYTSNGVTQHKLYVTIPNNKITSDSAKWTLTASETVETKLLSTPQAPSLKTVSLTKGTDLQYTANITTDGALAGDTVNLYLTPVGPQVKAVESEDSDMYNEAPDPGTLIAKDLPVANNAVAHAFDISDIQVKDTSGKTSTMDLRSLLAQGNYYLRAELKSASAFDTQTAATVVKLVDPKAPSQVTDFTVTPAGNGYFNLSFTPGAAKVGAEVTGYAVNFYQEEMHTKARTTSWEDYANYTGLTFTAEELKPYWNETTGRYENIRIGGQKTTDVVEPYTYTDASTKEVAQYYAMVDDMGNYINSAGETIYVAGTDFALNSQRIFAQDIPTSGIVLVKQVGDKYIRQDNSAEVTADQVTALWVNAVETNDKGETVLQDGKPVAKTGFAGLQTGERYMVGVSALHAENDGTNLDHYSEESTVIATLPVPKKPVLTLDIVRTMSEDMDAVVELYANKGEPTVSVVSDQSDVKVDILCGSEQYGALSLVNGADGKTSSGQVKMTGFTTDGTYFIQLKATNTKTGDYSMTGLYLTIDTLKPILFIDSPNPVTGTDELTENGQVRVAGKTSPGDTLTINGVTYENATTESQPGQVVQKDGTFDFEIPMANEAIMQVEFVATDKAGNSNTAAVYVANPNYQVPADITVQRAALGRAADATINIGETMPLTTSFIFKEKDEAASSKDVPVYTKKTLTEAEMAAKDPNYKAKLSYEIYMGSSAELVKAQGGTYSLKGLKEGGTVVKATYQVTADVALESYTSVDVTNVTQGEAEFNRMTLSTKPVGLPDQTRAIVENYMEDTVSELVYKTFPKGSAASVEPKAGDLLTDASGWKPLPADSEGNHIITGVVAEQLLVVAKRVITTGACTGTSNRATILTKSGTSGSVYLEKAAAGDYEHTKLVVESGAMKPNSELVYKLDTTVTPNVGDSLDTGWTVLPADKLIAARTGRNVAVAQRDKATMNCTETYKLMMTVADSFVNFNGAAESVNGNTTQTKVTATGGRSLASGESYVYLVSETAAKPVLYGALSADWKALPADGLVTATDGARILLAIKGTGGYAVGVANVVTAEVSTGGSTGGGDDPGGSGSGGGGGGGGGGGSTGGSVGGTTGSSQAEKIVNNSLKDSGTVLGSASAMTGSDVVDVKLPGSVTADKVTAVVFVSPDGNQTPIPFIRSAVKGSAYVTVKNMGAGSIVFVQMNAAFTDVPENHWSAKDIKAAADKLFMSGIGNNTFNMTSSASRSEFTTVVLRVMGAMSAKATATMEDVPETAWYYRGMAIAKQNGLLSGDNKGNMKPLENISRAEAMVIIGRALRIMKIENALSESEVSTVLSKFTDGASVPAWARADVALCVKYGIINGANGELRHSDKLTREQIAAIANRLDTVLTSHLFVVGGQ